MALPKSIPISVNVLGDGTTTTFTLDLLADPYFVNGSGTLINWFAADRKASNPTGVFGPTNLTVTLSGTVVTIVFSTAPAAGGNVGVNFDLLF